MAPDQVKNAIYGEYQYLLDRARRKEINHSCIENLIRARCVEGVRHSGLTVDYYMPDELKDSTNG